jgi:hypothetical protein
MDGQSHYRVALELLALTADPESAEEEAKVTEYLAAANVHMGAALIHALAPELARQWAMP